MEYELNFLSDKGIVYVKTIGRLTIQKARQFSIEAIKLGHLNNSSKYIIDHSKTDLEQGIYKLHTDGGALEQFGFKKIDKVAVIISPQNDQNYVNENKSQEARWCDIKYFHNLSEAENWLLTD